VKSGSNLESVLRSGKFAVTGELGPPRNSNKEIVREKAKVLKGNVDAVNITDCQTAIVRMSSLTAGLIALSEGIEPVMQMTCRDRNRIGMQADILGACALGIRNLLCLTGDHQKFGDHPQSKGVFDMDSMQLLQMVKAMRDEKKFQCGKEIKGGEPRLFLGAAANPFADPFEFRPIRLKKKVDAGADFIQTQIIYNVEKFRKFMEIVQDLGVTERVYILAGITPPKSLGMAKYMKKFVPGLDVTDEVIKRLKGAKDVKEEGIAIAVDIINQVREIKGVSGVHIMAIGWEEAVPEICSRAGLLPRPEAEVEAILIGKDSVDEAVEKAKKELAYELQGQIDRYKKEAEASRQLVTKEKEKTAKELKDLKAEIQEKEHLIAKKEERIQELLEELEAEKARIPAKPVASSLVQEGHEVIKLKDKKTTRDVDRALYSLRSGLESLKKALGLKDDAYEALRRFIEAELTLKGWEAQPEAPVSLLEVEREKLPPKEPMKKRDKEVVNLVAKGNLLLHQGKAEEALEAFKKALSIDSEDEKAKAGLKEAQDALNMAKAEERPPLREGVPPCPEGLTQKEWERKWVIRLVAKGYCALYEKKKDKGIEFFKEALRLDPENEKAKKGLMLAEGGEPIPVEVTPPKAEAPEEKVEVKEKKEVKEAKKEAVVPKKAEKAKKPVTPRPTLKVAEVPGAFSVKKETTTLKDRIGSIPEDLFIEKIQGEIRRVTIGDGERAITVGGEMTLPFYLFEGDMPYPPRIAFDVLDSEPEDMPDPLRKYYEDCLDDPVRWAKKCVDDYGAEMICLSLVSTDPNGPNRSSSEAAKIAKEVLDQVDCPVILWGCGNAEKDTETLREITALTGQKKVCIGPLTDANYRNLGATAMAFGLPIVASTPIDVNLAKQLNILLENLGIGLEHILMDPSIGAVGYGLEYTYSVMERIRIAAILQQDEKLQAPLICNVGREVWKAKEVRLPSDDLLGEQETRAIILEAITALTLLFAGGEIAIMRHPRAIALTDAMIKGLMG